MASGAHNIIALGFFVTLYGTLITLFGLAWVLFLIGKERSTSSYHGQY